MAAIVPLVAGLVLLVAGAELLVRGAAGLAAAVGISPLVVGLTVVAFGTSAPELTVSVGSAWSGQTELAIANVVGSNVFNVLFILGVAASITPLVVAQELVRRDVPLMIGLSLLALLLGLDGRFGRLDGAVLVVGLVGYTVWCVCVGRREGAVEAGSAGTPPPRRAPLRNIGMVLGGLALLVVGAQLFVGGATELAALLGLSETVIGLTVVAAGTSLPEVATSVVASVRGQRDIAVGNVIGSNLFNIMGVLGLSAAVAPDGLTVAPAVLAFDLPVMLAVAVACLPVFFTGHRIARWEGVLFLGYYGAYTAYLLLAAARHDALADYGWVMTTFVLPLTGITLVLLAWRARVRARDRAAGLLS